MILAPILLSTDISRDTMTPLKNQAQNGALRLERLDDLHPLSSKGQKGETMAAISTLKEQYIRKETDSLGEVDVPSDKLWGAQTQRSLEHFSIGQDLIPREMIAAYATLKKAAANANHAGGRLDDERHTAHRSVLR